MNRPTRDCRIAVQSVCVLITSKRPNPLPVSFLSTIFRTLNACWPVVSACLPVFFLCAYHIFCTFNFYVRFSSFWSFKPRPRAQRKSKCETAEKRSKWKILRTLSIAPHYAAVHCHNPKSYTFCVLHRCSHWSSFHTSEKQILLWTNKPCGARYAVIKPQYSLSCMWNDLFSSVNILTTKRIYTCWLCVCVDRVHAQSSACTACAQAKPEEEAVAKRQKSHSTVHCTLHTSGWWCVFSCPSVMQQVTCVLLSLPACLKTQDPAHTYIHTYKTT